MNHSYLRGIYLRLAGVMMLVVIAALAASAWLSHRTFERALAPEMAKKVASGGASARLLVLKALEHGMDFRNLYGIDQTFAELKTSIPEIAYVAVSDPQGKVLFERYTAPPGIAQYVRSPSVLEMLKTPDITSPAVRVSNQYVVSLPIATALQPVGLLHIGVGVDFVDRIVLDMLYDVLVVLVVALFFTLELLNMMVGSRLENSLRSLGETIERGAAGDFSGVRRRDVEPPFRAVLALLEAVRARVNGAYEALARDVDAGRRSPAHERPPGLSAAHDGLQALGRRYRFGAADAASQADAGQLAKVRAPVFLFILAEELTRPFLPGYVDTLLVPLPWLSPQVLVALPIVLFMLIVALAQPFLGAWGERVGHRKLMLTGAGIAAAGFLASAFAQTVFDLLLWRSLCAVGYAMVFVAGQGHVLEHASTANRARGFALFVGAIMAATVCGPSIGGILADNIGERATLIVAALLAVASIGAIHQLPDGAPAASAARPAARAPTLREIGALLVNRRFMTVTGLAAMPAKMLLTGVCFYLLPLYVLSIGSTQSMVGRMLMTYGVVMVVAGPLAASLATTRERMEWLVGGGLLVSGCGALAVLLGDGVAPLFAATALVGLGQSLSIAAQSALVREHCDVEVQTMGEPAVYGVYRLLERLGNALGPLLAAVLVLAFDYRTAFIAIGAFVLCCGTAFVLSTRRSTAPALAAA